MKKINFEEFERRKKLKKKLELKGEVWAAI
jgi:hypothetical protein